CAAGVRNVDAMLIHIMDPIVVDIYFVDGLSDMSGVVELNSISSGNVFNQVVGKFPLRAGIDIDAMVEQRLTTASHTGDIVNMISKHCNVLPIAGHSSRTV